jgi:REP element-mobilizing transposase RayT
MDENTGWRSRGYIPHFDQLNLIQLITFRLYDAVPEALILEWKNELSLIGKISMNNPRQVALQKRINKYEDSCHGACWLHNKNIAAIVEKAILYFDGDRYNIIAWCIMPNHVHAIIETKKGNPLADIMHSWKSYTAHQANRVLNRSGEFWFREYHDRFIRDDEHLAQAIEYVENNPVKARLAESKETWEWSSAWKQGHRERRRPAGMDFK